MKADSVIEVVEALVGEIQPVGETYADDKRHDNLEELCKVLAHFMFELYEVERNYRDAHQYSVNRASRTAKKWLKEILLEQS